LCAVLGRKWPPVSGTVVLAAATWGAGEEGSLGDTDWAQEFQSILEEG
jgi:hypothetical protein